MLLSVTAGWKSVSVCVLIDSSCRLSSGRGKRRSVNKLALQLFKPMGTVFCKKCY